MLKKKKKAILIFVIAMALIGVGIGSFFYINSVIREREYANSQVDYLSARFSVSEEYVKEKMEELKDWEKVGYRLMQEKHAFSSDEATALRDRGFLVEDIAKAQKLAAQSNVDKLKILECRGTYPGIKSWDKVAKELKLDLRSDAEKMNLSKENIKYFKGEGLKEQEIVQIGVMISNKLLNLEEIKDALKQGKTVEEIYEESFKNKYNKNKKDE